jgi:endonuclease/exonuclease/phosphatase family metal-dependent hydrolase
LKRLSLLPFILLLLYRCSANQPAAFKPGPAAGEFSLLTYNVAGLPQGVSASNPEKNIPLISPLLNQFDLALVQEDFYYHEQLRAQAQHPYQSTPKAEAAQFTDGDGLNQFSNFPFGNFLREPWQHCSNQDGSDCLAKKGFSAAETEIAPGIIIDVYNLHLDAGGTAEDITARERQIEQLIRRVKTRSAGRAIILAGDTNLRTFSRPQDEVIFQTLLSKLDLFDACRALGCGNEQIDRVLFRSSAELTLTPLSWQLDPDFVDESGNPLSDHPAVSVIFQWDFQPN